MTDPTWTILIPTLGQRRNLFERLLGVLLPQVEAHGGRVRVLAWWNNGQPSLGHVRQGLLGAADTDYVCFVDDDDLVASYYVDETLTALDQRPDMVGWQLAYHNKGRLTAIAYHTLTAGSWHEVGDKLYRDVTHINPMRAELARIGDFRRARPGKAEDRVWADQVRPHVRSQVYLDKIMYTYLYEPTVSAWSRPQRIRRGPFERSTVDSPYFRWMQP